MNAHHDAHGARGARPDARPAGEVTALSETGQRLPAEAVPASSGRAARTVVALPGLRATLLAPAEGRAPAGHRAPGPATLLCLAGRVTLSTAGRAWTLGRNDLVPVPEERHRLDAGTDALVLLTVRPD
ncbi:hypothetical protein GCM10010420_33330 [Streptomyces glaucosporus]|uniref:Cupin 2 conserved barrel domain-containing protein n=1 Tax=Streptomyces glaucosporus TaxID=284044 RepID=A0ABP5VMM6_9ACTN